MHHRDRPTLHLVADSSLPWSAVLTIVEAAARNGLDWVQIRDHRATAREIYQRTRAAIEVCRPLGVRVAVNDRVDVALAAGADGVQVGNRGLPIASVRRIGPHLQVGASVHSAVEAARSAAEGADWITFGHVFASTSHPGEEPRGVDALAEVARGVSVPVIAIGGIAVERVPLVLAAGAAGVAVISAITRAPDPARATVALRQALDNQAT